MNETLASALLAAVRQQDFGATADSARRGQPVRHFPSIDLAVAAFLPGGAVRSANVLFSREFPQGMAAPIDASEAGAVHGAALRFDRDQQDAAGDSHAWAPNADWQRITFEPLAGSATASRRFVVPYPASLLKLMVAVGVGMAVDRGLAAIPDALEPMIVVSDNDATDTCVALLHRTGLVGRDRNALNEAFAARGLHTLQLNRTTPRGGWRNADGAGVGHIHMTAWDTVRLLWLLDAESPPAPWLPAGTLPLLSNAMRNHLRGVLTRQQRDEILSSGLLRGEPGWVSGLPDAPTFAHKTGTTENYASDAGIVRSARCHYAVAVLTNLGTRYAATPKSATTWRLPALGAAVHAAVEALG